MNTATFRTNLKTALNAVPALSTVAVHKYPPGKMATLVPSLIIADITVAYDDLTLRGTGFNLYTVNGGGYVPTSGVRDEEWAQAESDASTLLSGLRTALSADHTVGGVCTRARLSTSAIAPAVSDDGRVFMDLTWALSVQAVE